jgi:15-cis-phytoene synthase
VGLLSIEIFGHKNPACRDYAIALGQALQLTNILRDVRNDAERGRIYLPLAELKRCGITEAEILTSQFSEKYARLAASVAERARHFYRVARETLPAEDRRSMVSAELMGSVYWRLLRKLEQRNFNVFGSQPVRLSKLRKLTLIFRSWLRFAFGAQSSDYGDSRGAPH